MMYALDFIGLFGALPNTSLKTQISLAGTSSTAASADRVIGPVPNLASRYCSPKRRLDTAKRLPGNPRDLITTAERRFPVCIRVGIPPDGFGELSLPPAEAAGGLVVA